MEKLPPVIRAACGALYIVAVLGARWHSSLCLCLSLASLKREDLVVDWYYGIVVQGSRRRSARRSACVPWPVTGRQPLNAAAIGAETRALLLFFLSFLHIE